MINVQDIKRSLQNRLETREPRHNPVPALVVEVDGSIRFPYKPSFVWIKLFSQPEGITTAHANNMTLQAGVPVWVEESPQPPYSWKIIGVYTGGLNEGGGGVTHVYNSAPHGQNHQIQSEQFPGLDPVLIYQPAIQILKTKQIGGLSILVESYLYSHLGERRVFPGDIIDLTEHFPSSGFVKNVLVSLNYETNLIEITEGTTVVYSEVIPVPYPDTPDGNIPSAYVKLVGGSSSITTAEIEDTRGFLSGGSSTIKATSVGQVMYSVDGITMAPQQPIVDNGVWIANNGVLLVT